jgi:hypothetical protein
VLSTTLLWSPEKRVLGFAVAYSLHLALGGLAVVIVAARVVPGVRTWQSFASAAFGGLIVAAIGRYVLLPHVLGGLSLLGSIVVSALAFVLATSLVDRSVRTLIRDSMPAPKQV